jgi:hypothetical protein
VSCADGPSSIDPPSSPRDPVVDHLYDQLVAEPRQPHLHAAFRRNGAVARKRVVDRVLHQLVEHDSDGGGDVAPQLAGVAGDLEA